ncbi:hypothetical protein DVH24_033487 [Malus domestica]|uniref:Uncharacterized protein n=1 Tax=Malus domestica TaxID=3750 RepID=A0A498JGR0_MALDO|nr:hypothetical protein DVH24_033487 [Malus domestica]
MEDASNSNPISENRVKQEALQLAALLREMKEGLDTVRAKVQALTAKESHWRVSITSMICIKRHLFHLFSSPCQMYQVKANNYPRANIITFSATTLSNRYRVERCKRSCQKEITLESGAKQNIA